MARPGERELLQRIDGWLAEGGEAPLDAILRAVVEHLGCALGTVHVLDGPGAVLRLCAQRDLPPPVLEKVREVPLGKGMAGLAAERREPVQLCNLQQDESVVRPGAKLTRAEGSIACPMIEDGELVGVLGVAKREPHDFSAAETALLMEVGRRIAHVERARRCEAARSAGAADVEREPVLALLARLLEHMAWADQRVGEALRAASGAHAKELELYAHLVGAEEVWLARIEERAPEAAVWPRLALEECVALSARNRERYAALAARITVSELARAVRYVNSAGQAFQSRVDDMLVQAALHGAYHRGQIADRLRAQGGEPAATDYIAFVRGAPAAKRAPR